jgi:hypothetical protein
MKIPLDLIVIKVSARVALKQTFSNSSDSATGSAKYVFPVPASAAVCAFELQFEDGSVVTGVAKEKKLASKEYDDAVRAGKPSGLVDWVADDGLFTNYFTVFLCLKVLQSSLSPSALSLQGKQSPQTSFS